VGDTLDGRFLIEAQAGAGGMGTVFRGRDLRTETPVAVKILRVEDRADAQRFMREAAALADLCHPAIVRYVAHGIEGDGTPYLAMEWVDGVTLAAVIAQRGLGLRDSVGVARGLADALAAVHAHGLVHRDVKPVNILFPGGDVGRPKLIDFGIARRIRDVKGFTRTGALLGTPSYMAPEQARGARQLDARVDVFALGCVLYECLTGRVAFAGEHLLAVRAKVLLLQPPPLASVCPEAPRELIELVNRMLAKNPAARPADGAAVSAALAALGDFPDGKPHPSSRTEAATVLRDSPAGVSEAASVVSMVMAATMSAEALADTIVPDGTEDPATALRRVAEPFGGQVESLGGAGLVITFVGDPTTGVVERAARCALAIREALPDVRVSVSTTCGGGEAADAVADALDRGADSIVQASMQDLFGGLFDDAAGQGDTPVDELTVRLLPPGIAVDRGKRGPRLRGRR
jgi:hypothetical protein